MKGILVAAVMTAVLTAGHGHAQMGQGQMMGQGMMGSQTNESPAENPYDSGMMNRAYGMNHAMMGQGMHPGMMGYGGQGMAPCMMGGGMMGYGGYGMGPGMMGHMGNMMGYGGYGMGPGMMGKMGGGMMGYGPQGYNPEAGQKFLDETRETRKKLHNRKFEYFEAMRNPEAKREDILKMEREIRDLQWELYEKASQ
jgi:hypothetical protein